MADGQLNITFKKSKEIKRFFKEFGVYPQYELYAKNDWMPYMYVDPNDLANAISQTSLYQRILSRPQYPTILEECNLSTLFRIFQIVTRIGYDSVEKEQRLEKILYYDLSKKIGNLLFSKGTFLYFFLQMGLNEKTIKENIHTHKVYFKKIIKERKNW